MNQEFNSGLFLGIGILLIVAWVVWYVWPSIPKPGSAIIRVMLTDPRGQIPMVATEGSAAFDLKCIIDPHPDWCINHDGNQQGVRLDPGTSRVFSTGLAFEIPEGYVMLVMPRSGHGFKWGVTLANSVGVIDSDYRGEVKICLHNHGTQHLGICSGDRIAQALIVPRPDVRFIQAQYLESTERGFGGFGSTGDS